MKVLARALKMSIAATVPPMSAPKVVSVAPDGAWHAFHVDELTVAAYGEEWVDLAEHDLHALSFKLADGARRAAVDVGVGDDTFETLLNGSVLGAAGAPGNREVIGVLTNAEVTFADHAGFSFLATTPPSGRFELSGRLLTSALFDAQARPARTRTPGCIVRRSPNTSAPYGALALLAMRLRRS